MTEVLQEPLTPVDCDLRAMPWMRLDVARVLDSDLFAISTGAEFKAAFALWGKSWYQVPAASLPDDDRVLAHLSGAGPRWKKLKAVALRGWIKCSDGRLYHPVIAEKALEAMDHRDEYVDKVENRETRQQRHRERRAEMFELLREHGVVPGWKTKTDELERLIALLLGATPETPETPPVTPPVTQSVTGETPSDTASATPPTAYTGRRRDETVNTKGVNDDVGNLIRSGPVDNSDASSSLASDEIAALLTRWECERGKNPRFDPSQSAIGEWVTRGITREQLRAAYDAAVKVRLATPKDRDSPVNTGFLSAFVNAELAPPKVVKPPLRGMSDPELCAEAKRLGFELPAGLDRVSCIARIEQMRAEHRGGHAP